MSPLARVQRQERVLERRSHAPQAPLKATDLRDAMFDQARLRTQTYLTFPELCAYARFVDPGTGALRLKAAYHWLAQSGIRRCGRGRSIEVLRRDVDDALQKTHECHLRTQSVPEPHTRLRTGG